MARQVTFGRTKVTWLAAVVCLVVAVKPAHAYIDPGTGSNLLSILGLMVGIICTACAVCFSFVKHWYTLLTSRFTSRKTREQPTSQDGR